MAVDKLVDSTQLDADLTSVANAIRTKGGTSASIAFPSGFVSAIGAIPSGGGGVDASLVLADYKVPSAKWVIQNCIPNYIADGGCLHIIYTTQFNSATDKDYMIPGIGTGAMSSWSPGTNAPCLYPIASKQTSNLTLHFRGGGGDTYMVLSSYADANGKIDAKFYSDHWLDVNTNTSYNYETGTQTWWTKLATISYLSLGQNQSNPFSGAIVKLLAIEGA